jgi:hypothetical protein
MRDDDDPSALTEESRRYLEALLEETRRAALPGSDELIKAIIQILARTPPPPRR